MVKGITLYIVLQENKITIHSKKEKKQVKSKYKTLIYQGFYDIVTNRKLPVKIQAKMLLK